MSKIDKIKKIKIKLRFPRHNNNYRNQFLGRFQRGRVDSLHRMWVIERGQHAKNKKKNPAANRTSMA